MDMHHRPIIKVLVCACACFYMAYPGSCFTSNKGMTDNNDNDDAEDSIKSTQPEVTSH